MVKREVFGCEGKGRRLGFLERRQSKSFFYKTKLMKRVPILRFQ
jgi:hypothetical protein